MIVPAEHRGRRRVPPPDGQGRFACPTISRAVPFSISQALPPESWPRRLWRPVRHHHLPLPHLRRHRRNRKQTDHRRRMNRRLRRVAPMEASSTAKGLRRTGDHPPGTTRVSKVRLRATAARVATARVAGRSRSAWRCIRIIRTGGSTARAAFTSSRRIIAKSCVDASAPMAGAGTSSGGDRRGRGYFGRESMSGGRVAAGTHFSASSIALGPLSGHLRFRTQ